MEGNVYENGMLKRSLSELDKYRILSNFFLKRSFTRTHASVYFVEKEKIVISYDFLLVNILLN